MSGNRGSRRAALRRRWTAAWSDGGVLHRRWEDLRAAPQAGWHGMANWIKAVLAATVTAVFVLLMSHAGTAVFTAVQQMLGAVPAVDGPGHVVAAVRATLTDPVHSYLADHSKALPLTEPVAYALWQATGLTALAGGCLTRNNALHMTWVGWGAVSVAMIWSATPDSGRPVAAGAAALAWCLASTLALRGLPRRRTSTPYGTVAVYQPHITVHLPPATASTEARSHPNT
ncbi:hypothetical protein [Streptomyces prunicolor]|uniref:hypothetical protein n=1 Tax=Streptomyces prunicolor TaxID=67348 RepID=UPI00131A3477|nr:hypothetical protein [Streptomyces prunicolor]